MLGKILQIAKKTPFPARDGESVAINQITKILSKKYDVTVLAMVTKKHPLLYNINNEKIEGVNYYFHEINTTPSIFAAAKNLFNESPYIVDRFYDTKFEAKLISLLQTISFDFVHLEGVFPALYIDTICKFSKAKIILRTHNVEHQIWERLAENETNFLKRIYYRFALIPKLKMYEIETIKKCDAIIPISLQDETFFKFTVNNKKYCTVPVGYDKFPKDLDIVNENFYIGFLGALDWLPNIEGLQYFFVNVWKVFSQKHPEAVLNIAGRNMPDSLKKIKYEGVKIWGEVISSNDYISNQSFMIVPLLSGSGMRIKVVEAMALGKCVVSTKIGAEGVEAKHGKDIFLVDRPDEWLDVLEELYQNRSKILEIGQNAQNFIKENYNLTTIGDKLLQFYNQLK